MANEIADLQSAVADEVTLDQSMITLLGGLADKIEQNQGNPNALRQMAADLRANKQAMLDAVKRGTELLATPAADAPASTEEPASTDEPQTDAPAA